MPSQPTMHTIDEVPVRCRKCRDFNRATSTFSVLDIHDWPTDDPSQPLSIAAELNILKPVAVYSCENTACRVEVRISKDKLKELYDSAVAKRLGAIYLPL